MRRHYTQYTSDQRSRLVGLVRAGTAVPEAASRLGVKPSTAYKWARAARSGPPEDGRRTRRPLRPPLAAAGPQFARLVARDDRDATIIVRVGSVAIDVRPGFDAELLRAVVGVLSGGPA